MEHFQSDPANRYLAKQIVDSLPGPSLSPDSHQVSLGNEDDSATVLNTNGDREASLMLSRTEGADWERAVIYVDKFQDPQFVIQHYDAAIRAYKLCGFKVELTLACNHKTWKSPHEYAHFAASVARRYYGQVDAISTCNEPNNTEDGWLKPLPNLTLPQTERVMHMAAYRAIKAVDSRIKVYVGELSSQDSPLVFMKQVLAYNPKGFAGPLLADAESAHPYEWFTDKGDGTVPPFDLNPDPDSETIAIDSTDTYADFLDEAYASGQIATAEGKEPHIVFDEFGLSVRAVGRLSSRNVSDPFRTRIIISVINTLNQRNAERQQAGKEPLFDELSLYQQQSTKETWNTGIIDGHGRPDSTFYALCLLANRR